MLNYPMVGSIMPGMDELPKKKRDWRASLFDKLNPDGGLGLSDDDKERMGRQGLLQLASGLLSTNGGFGNALGAGISGGLLSMNQGAEDMATKQYKQVLAKQQAGAPTDFRAKDMMAQAAGYKPGTPEYQHFMRVQGGIEGKASSAGAQSFEMADENGVPTRYTFNPRSGQYEKAILGATMPASDPLSPSIAPSGDLFAGLTTIPGVQVTSGLRTPQHNEKVGGVANSYHMKPGPAGTGMARDILPPRTPEQAQSVRQYASANGLEVIDEGDHWHLEPRPQGRPLTGRRKEDEAGAVTAAQQAAEMAAMPVRNQLEAQGAGMV
ncbi:D-Ala-D-Ala carboxypeptidase family metallohydrolase [Lysobacter koreensis]|uniref:D-Ala-D-Ala carboxypeptidase family metallohydrolase n=1 Tax=Lysobacter koreensis TaxID=266122 RepID=A0ABW2YP54_9GAMM